MAEKDQVVKEKIDHSGIFDFASFYSYAHSWLKDEEYGVVEEKYSEKVSEKGRDITIEWKATKQSSDYFKTEISVKFDIKGLTEVEAEIDGKKKKMNKGSIAVELKGTLVRDPDSNWESSPFNRFIHGVYTKYVIPARIDGMQGKVFGDITSLKEGMKSFLSLTAKR